MAWVFLSIAGMFEVAWVAALKRVNGPSDFLPISVGIILLLLSVIFLSIAARTIPIGVAYAAWTGIGILGAVILGVFVYGEALSPTRIICVGLILVGIVGLRLSQSSLCS